VATEASASTRQGVTDRLPGSSLARHLPPPERDLEHPASHAADVGTSMDRAVPRTYAASPAGNALLTGWPVSFSDDL
jgi:hypothetical protein